MKFLNIFLVVTLILMALPVGSSFAQEDSQSTVNVFDGNIVYNDVIFDVSEMTGQVILAEAVPVNTFCLEEDSTVCLGVELVQFQTERGEFFLWPDYKWVTSTESDQDMWFQSGSFKNYSIAVSYDLQNLTEINGTTLSFGTFRHDFGRDIWSVEVSPSGAYVVVLMPPLESEQLEKPNADSYFGYGMTGYGAERYAVEVWSAKGERMYQGNLANWGDNPYGVWLSPEKTDLLQFDRWSVPTAQPSPDGQYVAYSDGYLPFIVFEGTDKVATFRYAGDIFQPDGSDWWYSEGGWFSAPPTETMTVVVGFIDQEMASCERVEDSYVPEAGECRIEFRGEYSTNVICAQGGGVTVSNYYFGSFDPTDGFCRQEGAFE